MRTGIYGGSFSPPHNGHIAAAKFFLENASLDRLIIIPSCISPQKGVRPDCSPEDRIKMLEEAFSDDPRVTVSSYETDKGGISYTYLTLQHFKKEGGTLCLLVGSDMFLTLDSWREPEKIFSMCEVWCLTRSGKDAEQLLRKSREYEEKYGAVCRVCENRPVPVSSTEVRRILRRGDDASGYLPEGVYDYVRAHKLYGCENAYIKEYIKEHISPKRYEHCLGVAETAETIGEALCMKDAELAKLIRAGLCHDISKELGEKEQLALLDEAGVAVDPDYIKAKPTLHQLSGAVLAKKLFGIDRDVYGMIQYHCTGAPGMNLYEKIIFLSDFIEPGREYEACKDLRRRFFSKEITEEHVNRMFSYCLKRQCEHIEEKGGAVHGLTRLAYDTEVLKMAENEVKPDLTNASSDKIAERIRQVLDEKLAKHIEVIPVADKTVVTDYFVIGNATSSTHVKALADEVEYQLSESGVRPLHIDGQPGGEWYVLDYGAVIVHIFVGAAREFYKLDRLWQDKPPMNTAEDKE